MTFQYSANKGPLQFKWWQMLLFGVLIIGFLFIIFPQQLFLDALMHDPHPSQVSIGYLKNLIEKDPSNIKLKVYLAEQELQIGEVQNSKKLIEPYISLTPDSELQWKILWLHYQLIRVQAFELNSKSPERIAMEAQLTELLPVITKSPYLSLDQVIKLADDSLAFDRPQYAVKLYKLAISKHKKMPTSFYTNAGKAALYVKDYQSSADFYLLAMQQSVTLDEKRLNYINAINSLKLQGTELVALNFAQKHIDGLKNDKSTLLYLVNVALQASQQKLAEKYVNQLLQLRYQE